MPLQPTTHDEIASLIASSQTTRAPASGGRAGRPPLYEPVIAHVLASDPEAVVFGPFAGTDGKHQAERIRTGCYSYVKDHPDRVPEGKALRFSVRKDRDSFHLWGWVEVLDGEAA